jgi:hypothetical protein
LPGWYEGHLKELQRGYANDSLQTKELSSTLICSNRDVLGRSKTILRGLDAAQEAFQLAWKSKKLWIVLDDLRQQVKQWITLALWQL